MTSDLLLRIYMKAKEPQKPKDLLPKPIRKTYNVHLYG